MVRISVEARFMVLEGDEYLSSPLDPRPKFHLYRPHIALLSGIAWDHMNVFPTFGNYVDQFRRFIELIEPGGTLIYCASDPVVAELASSAREDIRRIAYSAPEYSVDRGKTYLHLQDRKIPLRVFGRHNMENLEGARLVCREMGLEGDSFFNSLPSFSGASKRLQLLGESPETSVFKDFAHSPSKLNATIRAVKEQYPDRSLVACLELHTYSSLNKDFLPEYKDCMAMADIPAVYFSPHALALKRLPMLDAEDIKIAFNDQRLQVFTEPAAMQRFILEQDFAKKNLLLMSSGNFDGLDLEEISLKVLNP
jgi:UDP-N-acetylmuramate: L-alanyl-gamma-D-glutamyl-meso-diaminopimelate ligase